MFSIRELSESQFFPFKSDKIRQFIREGKLEVIRFGYNKIRITEGSIEKFISNYCKND